MKVILVLFCLFLITPCFISIESTIQEERHKRIHKHHHHHLNKGPRKVRVEIIGGKRHCNSNAACSSCTTLNKVLKKANRLPKKIKKSKAKQLKNKAKKSRHSKVNAKTKKILAKLPKKPFARCFKLKGITFGVLKIKKARKSHKKSHRKTHKKTSKA